MIGSLFAVWLGRPLAGLLVLLVTGALIGCDAPAAATPVPPKAAFPAANGPATGVLDVTTEPSGATVSLDGIERGFAPTVLDITPGRHTLRLALDGYEPIEVYVIGVAGEALRVSQRLVDVSPPVVDLGLAAPRVGAEDGCKVSATARDAEAIIRMTLFVDGAAVAELDEASLRHNLDTRALGPGSHLIVVEATDAQGNRGRAEARLEVSASPDLTQAPSAVPPTVPAPTVPSHPANPPTVVPTTVPTIVSTEVARAPRDLLAPVSVAWGETRIATYDYERALYTDPENAGHPYPLLHRDQVGSPREVVYRTLTMRNEYVELVLLPELGGRIYQYRYLPTDQALLYNNAVIKATHWGPEDQGWWLAVGGIEFCLPVNEHGYLTAEPWETSVVQHDDGSATASVHILEKSRHLDARVEITLRPGDTRLSLRSTITSKSERPEVFQYWINAMLSPGSAGVRSSLRFYYPTDAMIVHSRGEEGLPAAGERMSWPEHNGRDFSQYAMWRNWLGVFAPDVREPWAGLYDDETQLGIVRLFPNEIARGVKLFGFGLDFGHTVAYTDDDTQYVEVWGGLTPTFWDDATLMPGESVSWIETWYPLSGCGGISTAAEEATLYARRVEGGVEVAIAAPVHTDGTLRLRSNTDVLAEHVLDISPAAPYTVRVPLAGNLTGPITVEITDPYGMVRLSHRF